MATEPEDLKSELTKADLRAWGEALVKTGTEHLDLAMVRQGKRTLKEAEAAPSS
jgi:hypothetical protein